jgi:hypothetical protein
VQAYFSMKFSVGLARDVSLKGPWWRIEAIVLEVKLTNTPVNVR